MNCTLNISALIGIFLNVSPSIENCAIEIRTNLLSLAAFTCTFNILITFYFIRTLVAFPATVPWLSQFAFCIFHTKASNQDRALFNRWLGRAQPHWLQIFLRDHFMILLRFYIESGYDLLKWLFMKWSTEFIPCFVVAGRLFNNLASHILPYHVRNEHISKAVKILSTISWCAKEIEEEDEVLTL